MTSLRGRRLISGDPHLTVVMLSFARVLFWALFFAAVAKAVLERKKKRTVEPHPSFDDTLYS